MEICETFIDEGSSDCVQVEIYVFSFSPSEGRIRNGAIPLIDGSADFGSLDPFDG